MSGYGRIVYNINGIVFLSHTIGAAMSSKKKSEQQKKDTKPQYGKSRTVSRRDQLLIRIAEVLAQKS